MTIEEKLHKLIRLNQWRGSKWKLENGTEATWIHVDRDDSALPYRFQRLVHSFWASHTGKATLDGFNLIELLHPLLSNPEETVPLVLEEQLILPLAPEDGLLSAQRSEKLAHIHTHVARCREQLAKSLVLMETLGDKASADYYRLAIAKEFLNHATESRPAVSQGNHS